MGDMLKSSHTGEQITAPRSTTRAGLCGGCEHPPAIWLGEYGWRRSVRGFDGPKAPRTRPGCWARATRPPARKLYLGGLLTWRKITGRAVGCAQSNLVTFNGTWIGASGGKLISVV